MRVLAQYIECRSAFVEEWATKRVFIAPDRTREERIERGKLVNFIREKRNSDPINFYYISGTTALSHERVPKTTAPADVVTQPQTAVSSANSVFSDDVIEKRKMNFGMCCLGLRPCN